MPWGPFLCRVRGCPELRRQQGRRRGPCDPLQKDPDGPRAGAEQKARGADTGIQGCHPWEKQTVCSKLIFKRCGGGGMQGPHQTASAKSLHSHRLPATPSRAAPGGRYTRRCLLHATRNRQQSHAGSSKRVVLSFKYRRDGHTEMFFSASLGPGDASYPKAPAPHRHLLQLQGTAGHSAALAVFITTPRPRHTTLTTQLGRVPS